tara:strand:+ start:288 stop:518 length:231 start_codon:yes stop_codon:yes gene_type:complete
MIYTAEQIEWEVSQCGGTWVKRRNLRNKLKKHSNDEVNEKIAECKGKIRDLKAMGANQSNLRFWFAEVTQLEMRLL